MKVGGLILNFWKFILLCFFVGVLVLVPVIMVMWLISIIGIDIGSMLRAALEPFVGMKIPLVGIKIARWMFAIGMVVGIFIIGSLSILILQRRFKTKVFMDLIKKRRTVFVELVKGVSVMGHVTKELEDGKIAVFVPSVPTWFTGGLLWIERREKKRLKDIKISSIDTVRTFTSGGILAPNRIPELKKEEEAVQER